MTILTDGVHMISDSSVEELHAFAHKLGVPRSAFQTGKGHDHYDLTTSFIHRRAIQAGAQHRTTKQLVKILKKGERSALQR